MTDAQAKNEELMRAYRLTFGSPSGRIVMADLMRFCCFRKDAADDVEEGKRRAFLRIANLSQLSDDQILALYAGRDPGELK